MTQLQRTETGYRYADAEVSTGPLSPSEAQFAALTAGGLSREEAREIMGITRNTANKTADRLYFKLRVNNIIAAMAEARRRGYLRYCSLVLIVLFTAYQQHATQPRTPPRPPARIARVRREQYGV